MLGLKLTHVSKRGPGNCVVICLDDDITGIWTKIAVTIRSELRFVMLSDNSRERRKGELVIFSKNRGERSDTHVLHLHEKMWSCFQACGHDMETLTAILTRCQRNNRWPVDSPNYWEVMWSFDVSSVVTLISCWTNSRVAGNLRLHDAHVTSP